MKTLSINISLSQEAKDIIVRIQQQQNNIIRFAYNRLKEGKSRLDIENLTKQLKNIELCDYSFRRYAIMKAEHIVKGEQEINKSREKENKKRKKQNKKPIPLIENSIFGGKDNFYKRIKNQITNEQWKKERMMPLYVIGEANQHGNRKFNIDIINNKIIFKPSNGIKVVIDIPQLKRNQLIDLAKIAEAAEDKKQSYTISLTKDKIDIHFEEFVSPEVTRKIKNRAMGIDLNPAFIGVSISDIVDGEKQTPIYAVAYEISGLFDKTNKSNYELNTLARKLVRIAKWYQCDKISLEDLSMHSKNHCKGRANNKLINNNWNRNLVINKIKSFEKEQEIEVVQVNAAYSSTIGNLIYDYFDPISSSLEIARRGVFQFTKGKFYPKTALVKDQWKEYLTEKTDWKDLHEVVKSRNLKYRVPLAHYKSKGFSSSFKSCIQLYNFI